jgi:eukaryotic-like serine/threonine-protein kinase
MKPERWQQIEGLYQAAMEHDATERENFLDAACSGDEELRREVESLLVANEQVKKSEGFLKKPALQVAAQEIAEDQVQSLVGRKFGRYQILSLLGVGGMGEVYLARDTRLDRNVAVKILPEHLATDPEALRRFEREAKAVAALSHPNILSIFDFGVEDGVSFAVMELLEGETLRERLRRSSLSWREAVKVGALVADGLAAAHAKGIIHRDLKPENIFLTSDGGVKILDFGIARVKRMVLPDAKTDTSTLTTKRGTVMGTLGYMSPEQVRGESADAPSDIFSFGCVLYEMISGHRPFTRSTTAELIAAILKEEPPALAQEVKAVPEAVDLIIKRCLEKRPIERFQSARDLTFDMKAALSNDGATRLTRAQAPHRLRLAVWIGIAAASVLLAVVGGIYLLWWRGQAIDSLAVLPLVNASGAADVEYLSDGITESIINSLSQLPQLKRVIARSTVASYKNKEVDPRKVGKELDVLAVLTGNMIQRGDDLIISSELVNVADGSRLWGGQYNRKLANVIEVQAEIAKQIAEELRLSMTGEERQRLAKHHTENSEAYRLYLKGRYNSLNSWNADGFKKGIDYLNQALNLDPTYALAHAGLAATYYDASGVWLHPNEAMPKARAAATNALWLDETICEAHTALAQVQAQYEWDWMEAERHYKRALELNPNFAPAHLYHGIYLAHRGRLGEGIEEIKKAQRLDPLTPLPSLFLGFYHYIARRNDEAISQYRKILGTDPNFYLTHSVLGLAYEQKGMFAEAIAEFKEARRLDPEQPFTLGYLGHAYATLGKRDEARVILDEMKRRSDRTYVDPFSVAIIYVGLGEKDEAFVWLDKAYDARSESLLYYKDAPILDPLRADLRFTDLLRRMKLAP